MAISKCIKCDNTFFEMAEKSPSGSKFKQMFIQCSKCGGVVGVQEYFNIGAKLQEIEKMNESNTRQLKSTVLSALNELNGNLQILLNEIKKR